MWKNNVVPGKPQMTIRRMRFACWIPKATNTHSEYETIIAFLRQQWLRERAWCHDTRVLPALLYITPMY